MHTNPLYTHYLIHQCVCSWCLAGESYGFTINKFTAYNKWDDEHDGQVRSLSLCLSPPFFPRTASFPPFFNFFSHPSSFPPFLSSLHFLHFYAIILLRHHPVTLHLQLFFNPEKEAEEIKDAEAEASTDAPFPEGNADLAAFIQAGAIDEEGQEAEPVDPKSHFDQLLAEETGGGMPGGDTTICNILFVYIYISRLSVTPLSTIPIAPSYCCYSPQLVTTPMLTQRTPRRQ
jgi:hypothetical protein